MMSSPEIVFAIRIGASRLGDAMPEAIGAHTEEKNVLDAIGASGCEPDTALAGRAD
jgi:hypothetical protein